jgi:hypothetical protein
MRLDAAAEIFVRRRRPPPPPSTADEWVVYMLRTRVHGMVTGKRVWTWVLTMPDETTLTVGRMPWFPHDQVLNLVGLELLHDKSDPQMAEIGISVAVREYLRLDETPSKDWREAVKRSLMIR